MRLLLPILMASGLSAMGANQPEETAVVATVQKFFDSMAAHDPDAARAVILPEGRVIGAREKQTTNISQEQFAANLATTKNRAYLERMWNPKVLIRGPIAQVWAEYDFHLDGRFTHCGIDSFSLVKTAYGWKIAGIVYTVETTGCAKSPLDASKE